MNFTCICHYGFTGDRCERYKGNLNFYPKYKCILFVEQILNKDRLNMLCYWKKALDDQNNVNYAELRGSAEIPSGSD